MRQFNSSISTVGIKEPKVQQAILKLLENSLYQKERLGKVSGDLQEEIRRLKQKLSTIDFDIDDETAQGIADKISEAIGSSVSEATAAAQTASQKADAASAAASSAQTDAQEVRSALNDIEGTIERYAKQAAQTASQSAVASATQAAQTAQAAATTATQKATAATTSANNAATTATQAVNAATQAAQAVAAMRNVNLSSQTAYNATYDQYRKIATLPAVGGAAGATVTIYGSLGGFTNSSQRPVFVSLSQRQSGAKFEDITVNGFVFGASLPTHADIVLYKESNNAFSLYLKGTSGTYFKHNVAMMYNENVTAVDATYTTTTPTGILVWSLQSNHKVVATTADVEACLSSAKTHSNTNLSSAKTYADGLLTAFVGAVHTWSLAQTFTSLITANGQVLSKGTGCMYYQGRDKAAFRTNVSTESYVPAVSLKSHTGSWEIATYQNTNNLKIVYITDENHSTQTNVPTVNITIGQDGCIYGVTSPGAAANNTSVATTAWVRSIAALKYHTHDYAPSTREYVAWSHINVDLAGSTYMMTGLVSTASATYNVRVVFRNTSATARTVAAGGKSASLASGNGSSATIDFTVAGNGTFTIDNIASSVDVFVRIWR